MDAKGGYTAEEQWSATLELYALRYHFDFEQARTDPEWQTAIRDILRQKIEMVRCTITW